MGWTGNQAACRCANWPFGDAKRALRAGRPLATFGTDRVDGIAVRLAARRERGEQRNAD